MAGIDKAAIGFTIAIVAVGVAMALYGDSIQSTTSPTPTIPRTVEPEPPMEETMMEETMEETMMEETMEETMMEETMEETMMEETMEETMMEETMEETMMEETMEETMMEETMEETMMEETMEETSGPQTVIVDMAEGTSVPGCETTSDCYIPESVTINIGDTVEWINVDTVAHTVTSGSPHAGPSGEFDSSLVLADASFAFTFEESGSFDYFCLVHPWMVGDVQVN